MCTNFEIINFETCSTSFSHWSLSLVFGTRDIFIFKKFFEKKQPMCAKPFLNSLVFAYFLQHINQQSKQTNKQKAQQQSVKVWGPL
jgi:hypothetical protein